MSKVTRKLVAASMLSSLENYLFEILDSVENQVGKLTPEDAYSINAWVRGEIEKAAENLEDSDEQ
ncbi:MULTISPECIES: hypothetical protein [unclassified Cedecea]|uniref:hypothetical protein n=1 Tax=unclassified Cedecea TaxID=2649846 RepID=UPI0030188610